MINGSKKWRLLPKVCMILWNSGSIAAECRSRIDEGLMLDILDEFDHVLGRNGNVDSDERMEHRQIKYVKQRS